MPWTKKNYPASMKNLAAAVRHKAIDIANALVEEEMEEGLAIATAISRAKDWAANHKKPHVNKKGSHSTDVKIHGKDVFVVPLEQGWGVKEEGAGESKHTFRTKQKAVHAARKKAQAVKGALTIQKKTGKVQKRISYNPNRKAAKSGSAKTTVKK